MLDPATAQGRGFCFVTFVEKSAADQAVKMVSDFSLLQTREVKCNNKDNLNASGSQLQSYMDCCTNLRLIYLIAIMEGGIIRYYLQLKNEMKF